MIHSTIVYDGPLGHLEAWVGDLDAWAERDRRDRAYSPSGCTTALGRGGMFSSARRTRFRSSGYPAGRGSFSVWRSSRWRSGRRRRGSALGAPSTSGARVRPSAGRPRRSELRTLLLLRRRPEPSLCALRRCLYGRDRRPRRRARTRRSSAGRAALRSGRPRSWAVSFSGARQTARSSIDATSSSVSRVRGATWSWRTISTVPPKIGDARFPSPGSCPRSSRSRHAAKRTRFHEPGSSRCPCSSGR